MSAVEKSRQALLQNLFAAFNRHDADGVMACMTQDIVFDTAVGPEMFGRRLNGTADVKAAFEQVWGGMPDVSWTCTRHSVVGDIGLSEWIFRGTAGDGRRIEAEGCDIFEFTGELISSKRAFRKERPMLAAKVAGETA